MDVELFLEGHAGLEVESPHHPFILHEMFQHAAEQGWKEVECMICCGQWHSLPKLDPKVDISAVQLVGPETHQEEFRALYYKVYKMRRLPGSPLGEPEQIEELTAEITSSLKDHLGWKEDESACRMEKSGPSDVLPLRSETPRRGRRDTSAERGLTVAREAHQKALATTATLEEEIEWLSCSITWGQSGACTHSRSQDCHRWKSQGWDRRCCWV